MATPRASAAGGVHVVGMAEFLAGLQAANVQTTKAMTTAHRRVAALVVKRAKPAAPGDTKAALRPIGRKDQAVIRVGSKPGRAIGTFMGAKRRFGWYAAGRYQASKGRQFRPWVGNQWDPGEQAGKPYFIGSPINESTEEALEVYQDELEKVYVLAYPLKTG